MFLLILGAPGSGKGTQCEKLVEEFGYTHISTGDLIRMEIKKGTNDGNRLKQFVEQGQNAPLDLTTGLLVNALIANPSMVSIHSQDLNSMQKSSTCRDVNYSLLYIELPN